MNLQRTRMLVRFVTCFMILLAVAVQRSGHAFGHEIAPAEVTDRDTAIITTHGDAVIVNTTSITSDIKGYGGPTPLEITIQGNRITDISPLKNSESPAFFDRASSGLIPQWIGTSVSDVASKQVDAVTGATLSSAAINANVKAAVAYASQNTDFSQLASSGFAFSWKTVAALAVVLCAAILPIFIRKKAYRYLQLALNVAVLGFWSGTFLSYEVFVNYIANGANLLQSAAVLLMLVIAFVYPYFGRKSHYCTWVCPLGSIQELAGKATGFKLKLSPKLVKALTAFQECLWLALMFVMCAGIWFEWMNWELFTAFIFRQAASGVIVAAILFVMLSVVVNRPYCRFVCPTGCLFQITQNPDK